MFILSNVSIIDNSTIGYLHNLSPVKESEKKNSYFDMKIQTRKRTYRAVCFDSNLHDQFNAKYESSSPIKIANIQKKVNPRTSLEEILINQRSKILDLDDEEVDFDLDPNITSIYQPVQVSIKEISDLKPVTLLDVSGRITFHGQSDWVNIRGKEVKMQEAVITDNSGTMRLVLWEKDISKIQSRHTYHLKRAIIKDFNKTNYLTLNKQTEINETQLTVERLDENVGNSVVNFAVRCPPEGAQSVHRYLLCNKCRKLILVSNSRKVVKCSDCGLSQLKSNCKPEIQATAFFTGSNGSKVSVLLKENIIEKLFTVYKTQTGQLQRVQFQELTDDDILEVILSVSKVDIIYNNNKVAQNVTIVSPGEHSNDSNSGSSDLLNEEFDLTAESDDNLVANVPVDEQLD